jgi:hypothetical protein
MSLRRIVFVLLVCGLFLTGCMDACEEYIQGDWYYDHNPQRLSTNHIAANDFEYWTFDHGRYNKSNCCLHHSNEHGYYTVLDSGEDWIILDLMVKPGEEPFHQIRIEIDRVKDVLYFDRVIYLRGIP